MTLKNEDMMTVLEAAHERKVSPQSIYQLISRGKLSIRKIDNKTHVLRSEVLALLSDDKESA